MSRKDYRAFAEMVRRLDLPLSDRLHVALMLCGPLSDQSNFDREMFLRECEVL